MASHNIHVWQIPHQVVSSLLTMIHSMLLEKAFESNPTALDLIQLVLAFAVLWTVIFLIVGESIRKMVYQKPWLVAAGEKDYERNAKKMYADLGLEDEATLSSHVEFFQSIFGWHCCVIMQHIIGGMLCVPATLGSTSFFVNDHHPEDIAISLACLGILSELGWEISDICTWLYKRYYCKDGRKKVPGFLVAILLMHHSLTTVLGIPVILHYRNYYALHWLCFDLQVAGAVALFAGEYTKFLDVSKPSQLKQFQILSFVALVILAWTRGIHWMYLVYEFCSVWYEEKAWSFLVIGGLLCLVFTVFNFAFVIQPFYLRFLKFMRVSSEYVAFAEDTSEGKRRSSLMALESAGAELFPEHELEEHLISLFSGRRVSRRQTMPASLSQNRCRRTSYQLKLMRASIGDISMILNKME